MKAVITTGYGSPEVFKLDQVAKPDPKANEVLVRIHASSVTKADSMMRTGKPYIGRLFLGLSKPKHPIWGSGFAGVIEAVGSAVKNFKKGDNVFGENINSFGTYAQFIAIAEDCVIAKLPKSLSFEEAAGICDGGITSLNFLQNIGNIHSGQKVLINGGSGSLGTAAIQIAKYYRAHVTAVCSTANMELVRSLGADEVIDYTKTDFTHNKNYYDLIYDTVGTRSFEECKPSLKENGCYASPVLGMPLIGQMMVTSLFGNKKAKFSATGSLPKKEIMRLLNILIDIIKAGHFIAPVDRTYKLEQVVEAHTYVDKGRKKGNVVLKPFALS
ncbi:MAG: NAD(P)-dependent alcohol dehydrogenase [Cytophagales bacterium]|uniref:NAD(P)-dependent alcohol dehydrogenase n=1 Tax=Cyclobacterium marinum TaxID=104 RepID=UPI0030DDD50B|nr:NAD(P)-dependent alcohol dehydrogenase [Cytophagales bacterium]|tara:strand:- start:48505 stop:49488 length:984 start_codon:yes stop_codon:yes gene_type:complete